MNLLAVKTVGAVKPAGPARGQGCVLADQADGEMLDARDWQLKKTEATIAAVEAGEMETIPHDEVVRRLKERGRLS